MLQKAMLRCLPKSSNSGIGHNPGDDSLPSDIGTAMRLAETSKRLHKLH